MSDAQVFDKQQQYITELRNKIAEVKKSTSFTPSTAYQKKCENAQRIVELYAGNVEDLMKTLLSQAVEPDYIIDLIDVIKTTVKNDKNKTKTLDEVRSLVVGSKESLDDLQEDVVSDYNTTSSFVNSAVNNLDEQKLKEVMQQWCKTKEKIDAVSNKTTKWKSRTWWPTGTDIQFAVKRRDAMLAQWQENNNFLHRSVLSALGQKLKKMSTADSFDISDLQQKIYGIFRAAQHEC